jgi:hypothetical protein
MAYQVSYSGATLALDQLTGDEQHTEVRGDGLFVSNQAQNITQSFTYGGITFQDEANIVTQRVVLQGQAGAEGYVIKQDADGKMVWADGAGTTPNLASVLAVATAGDADAQPITNLQSLGLAKLGTGIGSSAVVLEPASVAEYVSDILNINQAIDETLTTRQFAGTYLPIQVNGTNYWIQLYSAVPP